MSGTLFFVADDNVQAEQIAAPYRSHGWGVEFASPYAEDTVDRMAEAHPLAAVFCIENDCFERTRELAHEVLADPRRIRPLMVFLGGDDDQIAAAKSDVSVGLFVKSHELPWVLKHLTFKG